MSTLIFPSNIQQDHTLLTPTSQGLLFPGELKPETSHTVISPLIPNYSVGKVKWGEITGDLKDQNDLSNRLNELEDSIIENTKDLVKQEVFDEHFQNLSTTKADKSVVEEINKKLNDKADLSDLDNIKLDDEFINSVGNRTFKFNGFNSDSINITYEEIEVTSNDIYYHTKFKNFFASKGPNTYPFEGFISGSDHGKYITDTTSAGPSIENYPFIYSDTYGFIRISGGTLYINGRTPAEYQYEYGSDTVKYYRYNNEYYTWDSRGTSIIKSNNPVIYTYNFKLSALIDYSSYLENSNIEQNFINIEDNKIYVYDKGELIEKTEEFTGLEDGSVTKRKLEESIQNLLDTIPTLASKQDALVSGENISTINGQSLLNGGNIQVGVDEETLAEFNIIKNKMDILYKVSLSLGGGKNVEVGTTQTVNLSWTIKVNGSDVNPSSQTISNGTTTENLVTTARNKTYSGVTKNTTYTLTVDGVTATASVKFYYPAYFGVVSSDYQVSDSITGLTKLSNYGSKSHNATTSTAGYNKVVYMYPSSLGVLTTIKDGNNFELLSSFTRSTVTINSVSYYAYVLTSATNTASQTFKFS